MTIVNAVGILRMREYVAIVEPCLLYEGEEGMSWCGDRLNGE